MSDFERIRINSTTNPYFPELWKIYESSFPVYEKRSLKQQEDAFAKISYVMEAWLADKQLVAFSGWWQYSEFAFIEHFAIHPDFRSLGYGSRLFQNLMSAITTPILLEIEPMTDEITRRRFRFYERLGFMLNDFAHKQPPYYVGMEPLPLFMLSYPTVASEELYESFAKKQKSEIMPQL